MRYRCIHRRRNLYPIQMMCQAVKVSQSGYYAWRTRPESRRRYYDRELTQAIRLLHAESGGTYGSPQMHAEQIADLEERMEFTERLVTRNREQIGPGQ